MGEIVEALKRNKFLNKATTPEERARRVSCLSGIVLDYNDETLERLAERVKNNGGSNDSRDVSSFAVMYRLYGERK